MLLSMAEQRLGLADRLARCFPDRREPTRIRRTRADMIRARIHAIACGYEDADDLDFLRTDPAFKLACGRLPDTGADLCSQPTMSRLENAPSLKDLIRLTYALVDNGWPPMRRRRPRSRSTSTTPATWCTAISSSRCSMRIMTSAAFCRSTSTRPKEAEPVAVRAAAGQDAGRRRGARPSAPPDPAHPRALAEDAHHWSAATAITRGPRRWRGARGTASTTSSACPAQAVLDKVDEPRPTPSGVAARRAQATMSCAATPRPRLRRQELEKRAARRRAHRSDDARPRHPLRRHQSRRGIARMALRDVSIARAARPRT